MNTSITYQFSNNVLFNEVYLNSKVFAANLRKGPETMKEYLCNLWNNTKNELIKESNITLKDKEKTVTIDDFDVTFNKTNNNIPVYFITLPDSNSIDATSKYVALAITKDMPRYFTLEYSSHFMDNTPCFVIGEFYINGNSKGHRNYGTADNMRLSYFAGVIIGMLEQNI